MNVTDINSTDIPRRDPKERQTRYRNSDKGKSQRLSQKRRKRGRDYLTRPFIAWDGEGYTVADRHAYTMLAHSRGGIIRNPTGLGTIECLEFMLDSDTRDGINIVYGGNYDVNMIVKDIPRPFLEELYKSGKVWWRNYLIEWRPSKQFGIRHGNRRFRLYDVLPFFQKPFVAACDEYLGDDWEAREQIITGKAMRGSFQESDMTNVEEYNNAELRNLVDLATELRLRLSRVNLPGVTENDGIRLTRWDGPGAIATALFQKYKTKTFIHESSHEVARATRHAYAGGRFEIIRQGDSSSGAYQYDINSAYPATIAVLPCLTHGKWEYRSRPTDTVRFGLYRIDTSVTPLNIADDWTRPQPLWYRTHDGRVIFGAQTANWYWTPEAQLALDHGAELLEAWEWVPECSHVPFDFVPRLYQQRAALKAAEDGAHVGIKLGLNSLYGKLAQQIGWTFEKGKLRIPPYHCLEWAGFITSACRAQLYRAAMLAPDDVIAFETDAIFTRVPLDLPIGKGLGEWEETRYQSLTYLMSGYYFGTKDDGKEIEKSRGVNKGSVTRDQLRKAIDEFGTITAEQTRFITLGQALHQDFDKWQQWITAPRELTARIEGKRIHALTNQHGEHTQNDGWLETWPNPLFPMENGFSKEYDIEWLLNTDYDRTFSRRIDEDRLYD